MGQEFSAVCEKAGHKYVQCANCRVVRQYPYPTQENMDQYYEKYHSLKTSNSIYLSDSGFEPFRRDKFFTFADLEIPDNGFKGKRICDVGCATGQFLQMMADSEASRLFGVDTSKECIEIGRSRGFECIEDNFLRVHDVFDVITMWHVIEHLPKPHEFIQHAFKLLSPSGWLIIETPVIGVISEAFGANWRYYMPTEHINLFPMDALLRVCCDAGFTLRNFTRFGNGNDSETVPGPNKRAMDVIAKKAGFGDTLALWLIKNA